MSAAAVATGDKNLALILEMGGDREQGYDPIPPDQYLAPLEMEIQLSPSGQKGLAWMRKWTLRAKRCGRTSYAASDGRRALKLSDMAAECKFTAPQASKVWRELEEAGFVRRDESERLCLNGRVRPRRNSGEDENLSDAEKFCTDNLPRYLYEQFQRLPENDYHRATAAYFNATKYLKRLKADAIASARDIEEEYLATVLAMFGITFRRHEREEIAEELIPEEKRPVVKVKFEAIAPPPVPEKLSVQNFSTEPVQATNATLYTAETEPVPDSHPYRTENRENRVSKCEDTGAPEALSGDDLPTLQGQDSETETQTPSEPAAAEPIEEKTLPVDENGTPQTAADSGAIVAYVEKLFGRTQSPAILRKFAALSSDFGASPATVTRFLLAKVEEKIKAGYEIRSAGALLQFAREDLSGWMKLNRRELGHSTRQERPAPAPAAIPPAEELADLERFVCENPRQPDSEYTRGRIAELRAQLGDAAPPPYRPPTKQEELAQLEADFTRFEAEHGFSAALTDVWAKTTRAKIRKLKQELGTAANGASS